MAELHISNHDINCVWCGTKMLYSEHWLTPCGAESYFYCPKCCAKTPKAMVTSEEVLKMLKERCIEKTTELYVKFKGDARWET